MKKTALILGVFLIAYNVLINFMGSSGCTERGCGCSSERVDAYEQYCNSCDEIFRGIDVLVVQLGYVCAADEVLHCPANTFSYESRDCKLLFTVFKPMITVEQ